MFKHMFGTKGFPRLGMGGGICFVQTFEGNQRYLTAVGEGKLGFRAVTRESTLK